MYNVRALRTLYSIFIVLMCIQNNSDVQKIFTAITTVKYVRNAHEIGRLVRLIMITYMYVHHGCVLVVHIDHPSLQSPFPLQPLMAIRVRLKINGLELIDRGMWKRQGWANTAHHDSCVCMSIVKSRTTLHMYFDGFRPQSHKTWHIPHHFRIQCMLRLPITDIVGTALHVLVRM